MAQSHSYTITQLHCHSVAQSYSRAVTQSQKFHSPTINPTPTHPVSLPHIWVTLINFVNVSNGRPWNVDTRIKKNKKVGINLISFLQLLMFPAASNGSTFEAATPSSSTSKKKRNSFFFVILNIRFSLDLWKKASRWGQETIQSVVFPVWSLTSSLDITSSEQTCGRE